MRRRRIASAARRRDVAAALSAFPSFLPSLLPAFVLPSFLPRISAFLPCRLPALPVSSPVRVARRFLISGRVQGVGFRWFTESAAARDGVHGWVRNLPDGRVEVQAEGDAEALDRFERALRHGPPAARVETIDVDAVMPTGRDTGFSVS
jgi:acylphosphatase